MIFYIIKTSQKIKKGKEKKREKLLKQIKKVIQ